MYTSSPTYLIVHCDKKIDLITEVELFDYFIHRQEVSRWSPVIMHICHAGIKFFFKWKLGQATFSRFDCGMLNSAERVIP